MPIIKLVKQMQALCAAASQTEQMRHQPEMLLIGCVDARKDPIADLGIPKGRSLILRNVAALVHPEHEKRLTESAALAFAVREMGVRHIAVMGHTDCGGIRAALEGSSSYSLRDYLAPISKIRDAVRLESDSRGQRRELLEEEAIKYSVRNLRSYDYIVGAEQDGRLTLHGWLLQTGSGRIMAWNEAEDTFAPLVSV